MSAAHPELAVYYRREWSLIEIIHGEKRPREDDWPNRGSKDPRMWLKWLAQGSNLGLLTGRASGVWVLDVDPRHGGDDSLAELEREHGKLPETVECLTPSGGRHLYFKMPADGTDIGNKVAFLPGLDIRGTRGQVLIPPSKVGGRPYSWEESSRPGDVEFASYVLNGAPKWTNGTGPTPKLLLEGQRNDALFRLGSWMRDKGLGEAAILAALVKENAERCKPPLDRDELESIAHSAAGYAPKDAYDQRERAAIQDEPGRDWESPVPLVEDERPPFPVGSLPDAGRVFVQAEAEATQTPSDMAGMLYLGVLATACQKKIKAQPRRGWLEPVNLFEFGIYCSGSRKSAVMRDTTMPLVEHEQTELVRLRPSIESERTARRIKEGRLDRLQRDAARADDPAEIRDLGDRASTLAQELAMEPMPVAPRLLCDDATPEALTSLLADHDGKITIAAPEGAELFAMMMGRYTESPNLGVWLQGHSGDPIRVDRKGRPAEFVPDPALTIIAMIQPEALDGLLRRRDLKGRGLLARILWSIPTNIVGSRRSDPPPVPEPVRADYYTHIDRLLRFSPDRAEIWNFSEEAQDLVRDFQNRMEPRLDPVVGDLASLADWGSKASGALVRIATLFQAAQAGGPTVGPQAVVQARAVVDYLIPHAKLAHAVMGANESVNLAQRLLGVVHRMEWHEFRARQLFNIVRGDSRLTTMEKLRPPLQLLEEHGHIRRQPQEDTSGKPGRKPSETFDVNPLSAQSAQSAQRRYSADSANSAE